MVFATMGKKKPPVDKVEMEVNLRLYAKAEREREEKIAAAKAAGTYKETEKPPIDRETALNVKANTATVAQRSANFLQYIFFDTDGGRELSAVCENSRKRRRCRPTHSRLAPSSPTLLPHIKAR